MGLWRWTAIVFVCCVLAAPAAAAAGSATLPPGGADTTSSAEVASGAPVPEGAAQGGAAPRIGPFRGSAEVGTRAAWWLLLLGGLQVLALMYLTRRGRSRLSVSDDEP